MEIDSLVVESCKNTGNSKSVVLMQIARCVECKSAEISGYVKSNSHGGFCLGAEGGAGDIIEICNTEWYDSQS